MRKLILTISCLVIYLMVYAASYAFLSEPDNDHENSTRFTYKEITKTDITKYADITANQILVFGISFNMSMEVAFRIIEKLPNVFFRVDPFNEQRYYLYDSTQINGKNISLAYFIWDQNGLKIKEIILYAGFTKYLVGDSRILLTLDVINKNADIVKKFMGYPSHKVTSLDLPSIGIKTYNYFYPNHNFKVIRNFTDKGTTIAIGLLSEITY